MKNNYVALVMSLFLSLPTLATEMFPIKLALNWKPEPQFGGFYAADHLGYFKSERLRVTILPGGSGTPTVQMLAFGSVDAAIVSQEEILISNEKNPKNPLIAIFAVYQINPQVFITPKSRNIKTLEDLLKTPGTISAQLGLSYVHFLKKKYPKPDITWVPYSGGIHGLLHEKNFAQQGFSTSEPIIAEKSGLKVSLFYISDSGFNPYTTVLAVRRKTWDKNPDKIKALVRAVRKGWKSYLEAPEATNLKLSKMNSSVDLAFFQESAKLQAPLIQINPLGLMTLQRWQLLSDQLKGLGLIVGSTPVDSQFLNLE